MQLKTRYCLIRGSLFSSLKQQKLTLKKSGLKVTSVSFIPSLADSQSHSPRSHQSLQISLLNSKVIFVIINKCTYLKNKLKRVCSTTWQCWARKSRADRKKEVSSDWWLLSWSFSMWVICSFRMIIRGPRRFCNRYRKYGNQMNKTKNSNKLKEVSINWHF